MRMHTSLLFFLSLLWRAQGTLISSRLFAGYQGWFATSCDEGHSWIHWTGAQSPAPGHVSFELYPDVRDYPQDALCPAGSLANLGNGQPAMLYSARSASVVDMHVKWAKEYGLDGLGLQRFVVELSGERLKHRDAVLESMKTASEKHGTQFYIEYDTSGSADFVNAIQKDWVDHGVEKYLQSPAYATDGKGKKFVMLWGCGFPDRAGTPQDWLNILEFFHKRNLAVGVGVPRDWRTGGGGVKEGFDTSLFLKFDLIEPWAVGSIRTDADIQHDFQQIVAQDLQLCQSHGIQYRRVLFPGFAWSNWNSGARNDFPRRAGKFMWNQALAAHNLNITGAFVAMFDEFDEGTAILKVAEDKSMIPQNQYFLSLDADGVSLSSDFYLRLTGAIGKLFRGEISPSSNVPVPPRTASTS